VGDALAAVQGDVPGYDGTEGSPAPAAVQQAIDQARAVIANQVKEVDADVDRANGDLSTVFGAAMRRSRRVVVARPWGQRHRYHQAVDAATDGQFVAIVTLLR
jgi:hypothetical protein